ncbi:MAG: hypothetical protein ABS949_09275 [Solibacillus sp.]
MKPEDLIFVIGVALIVLIVILVTTLIFRKRKKVARIIVSSIVIGYIVFFTFYPTIRSEIHAQRYDQLVEYLQRTYPNEEFEVRSRNYDEVIQLGDFQVNNTSTPNRGVTYRVEKNGDIFQLSGSWQRSSE